LVTVAYERRELACVKGTHHQNLHLNSDATTWRREGIVYRE